MAEKQYLDAEGLKILMKYIDDQIKPIKQAIEILNDKNGTPGSIQQMIDNAIDKLSIEDLEQNDTLTIYGGSAPNEEEGA